VQTALLLLAVWAVWINTVGITNYFDRGARAVRLMLIAVMFMSLIMSATIPAAFEERGPAFAGSVVAILVGGTLTALVAVGRRHHLGRVFDRVLIWWLAIGVLWLAGAVASGTTRIWIWALAVASIYLTNWFGFPLPGRGRVQTTEFTISGGHFAERCQLFVIIALGESILIAGVEFADLPSSAANVAAFVVAFVVTLAMWWIYFDRGAEAGMDVISAASDPGRLGVTAYTYAHVPMIAGIIVSAAAAELAIDHPSEQVSAATAAVILGGPVLYLLGQAWFKWAVWQHVPSTRFVGLLALVALVPLAIVASALVLLTAVAIVLGALALRDTVASQATGGDT
jgi:low temperature requirement protein LtrA